MDAFARIAEDRIQRAMEEGVFENLPGRGKPFDFEDDSTVPEDLRLAWKILRNASCVPPEVELRREIFALRQLLDAAGDPGDRAEIRRRLNLRILDLNLRSKC
jgi:hypothetical protein